MVKVHGLRAPIVPAPAAASTLVGDSPNLHRPAPLGDSIHVALGAPLPSPSERAYVIPVLFAVYRHIHWPSFRPVSVANTFACGWVVDPSTTQSSLRSIPCMTEERLPDSSPFSMGFAGLPGLWEGSSLEWATHDYAPKRRIVVLHQKGISASSSNSSSLPGSRSAPRLLRSRSTSRPSVRVALRLRS